MIKQIIMQLLENLPNKSMSSQSVSPFEWLHSDVPFDINVPLAKSP